MTGPTRGTTGEDTAFDYGAVTRSGRPFQAVRLTFTYTLLWPQQPHPTGAGVVWADSVSLAATREVAIAFLSYGY